jgi:hypothetical protein
MLLRVVQDYAAQYSDPIAAHSGQELLVRQQDDEYPGWWWCKGPDGKEGWVPEAFLRFEDGKAILLCNYHATELSACAGEELEVHEQIIGWARATNSEGRTGWLPSKHLATID